SSPPTVPPQETSPKSAGSTSKTVSSSRTPRPTSPVWMPTTASPPISATLRNPHSVIRPNSNLRVALPNSDRLLRMVWFSSYPYGMTMPSICYGSTLPTPPTLTHPLLVSL
ncbi:hypothetical protein H0H93_006601, partial [Arthromyces matolae]